MKEHPLRHRFGAHFTLQEFEASHVHQNTVIPMIVADQGRSESDAEAIQVNPSNDAFEDTVVGPLEREEKVLSIAIRERGTITDAMNDISLIALVGVIMASVIVPLSLIAMLKTFSSRSNGPTT